MGSAIKHVTHALTGKSGGGTSTTNQNENANSSGSSQSWLQNNPQYQALENSALQEAQNFNVPNYQLAGSNPNIDKSLDTLAQGVNTNPYNEAYNLMNREGQGLYNSGGNTLNGALTTLNRLGNMSQSDYQNMLKSEYNNDLVNSQIQQLSSDVTDQYNSQVQSLNQSANAAGAMGNSRTGVAQGVMAGQAQKAIASGSVQYRTAEEQQASNRLSSYLGLQSTTANSLASIGQNQQQLGLNMYGQGMNFYDQYNRMNIQNAQNMLSSGQMQRQMQQQQFDVNRQNALINSSPALNRLSYYNNALLPTAGLNQTWTSTGNSSMNGTSKTPGTGGSFLGGLMGIGGAAVGGYFGGNVGAMIGGGLGSSFGNTF